MRYALAEIPRGLAGTDQTVRTIGAEIQKDLRRPNVRLLTTRILRGVPSKDQISEARAIYDFVSRRIRYQKDPIGIETVQSPEATLAIGAGDCDDQAGLVAAMAASVGLPARFRVLGSDRDRLVHIFPEIFAAGRWIPADTTEPGHGFGWRPPRFPFERVYSVTGEAEDMKLGAQPNAITRAEMQGAIYKKVYALLSGNWQTGLINRADLESYLRVIDEGNFPSKQPLLVDPTRKAIADFLGWIDRNKIGSLKPAGGLSGYEGLSGFLSSVWNAAKGAVTSVAGTALNVIPGGSVLKAGATAIGNVIGVGPKPAPGAPNEGPYYGFTPAKWESIGAGNRGHVRNGDEIGQRVIAKDADLMQTVPPAPAGSTATPASSSSGSGFDYTVPALAVAAGLVLFLVLRRK